MGYPACIRDPASIGSFTVFYTVTSSGNVELISWSFITRSHHIQPPRITV